MLRLLAVLLLTAERSVTILSGGYLLITAIWKKNILAGISYSRGLELYYTNEGIIYS